MTRGSDDCLLDECRIRASVQDEVVNIRLFIFPELRMGMLAERVDETVSVNHKEPLPVRVAMIACFVGSHVSLGTRIRSRGSGGTRGMVGTARGVLLEASMTV